MGGFSFKNVFGAAVIIFCLTIMIQHPEVSTQYLPIITLVLGYMYVHKTVKDNNGGPSE